MRQTTNDKNNMSEAIAEARTLRNIAMTNAKYTLKQFLAEEKLPLEPLAKLKQEKFRIHHWRDKESSRDAVRVTIHDFLYSDETGLPVDGYTEDEVNRLSVDVFRHVFRAYPKLPSPYYEHVA
jgi:type I restriction enzyme R subunit